MTDIEQAKNTSNTSDELRDFKKKLAKDIVDKIQERSSTLAPMFLDKTIYNYLLNEENFKDSVADLGRKIILNTANLHFLENYRKKINSAETVSDLEKIKNEILGDIEKKYQGSYNNNSTNNGSNNIGGQENQSQRENQGNAQNTQQNQSQSSNIDTTSQTSTELAKVSGTESYEIDHLNFSISPETKTIYENIKGKEKPDLEPFACALKVYNNVKGKIHNTKYLTVVDFTKKKGKKRFFVINMENNTVEHAVKVGHGKNTGGERAKQFSNKSGSKQSSLGGYLLPDTITKSPNKSWSGLRQITGLESSNSNAAQRGIAVHPGGENGSEGCFTLPKDISKNIMEKIKGGFLFAYAESKDYFAQSNYFKQNSDGSIMA